MYEHKERPIDVDEIIKKNEELLERSKELFVILSDAIN